MRTIYILFLVILSSFAYGQGERILSYDVDVVVDTEADLVITETIKVNALGQQIKRGIVRALPISRQDADGKSVQVRYDVLSVNYDGKPSRFKTKNEGRFLKIYVGDANVFIPRGEHTYKIKYKTYNQIGFFENHDELYWNATGTYWDFPIDNVTATYHFPNGANIQDGECYTGSYGSNRKDCKSEINSSSAVFKAGNLRAKEGLTTVVAVDKGIINRPPPPPPPSLWEKFGFLILSILGGLVLGGYYIYTWFKHGIDPVKPTVYPIYDSPEGLSPAAVGSIHKDKVSYEFLSASIINLAVKGYLTIQDESSKSIFGKSQAYRLTYLKPIDNNEPQEEREFFNTLFSRSKSVLIDGEYDRNVEAAVDMYQMSMQNQYRDLIEEGRNYHFLTLPILLMVGILIFSAATHLIELPNVIGQIFSGGLFFSIFALMFFMPILIKLANKVSWAKWVFPIVIIAVIIGVFVAIPNAELNTYVLGSFLLFGVVSIVAYKYFIERPSEEKLRLQSLIEGFKMYMSAAENHQIANFNPPAMTPEVFEKMLPYALALKADKVWGEKFQKYLATAAIANYATGWYVGGHFDPYMFSVMNNTMRNTVNNSTVQPAPQGGQGGGSNWGSGMGGGGFSGGGGGGGGGGGW